MKTRREEEIAKYEERRRQREAEAAENEEEFEEEEFDVDAIIQEEFQDRMIVRRVFVVVVGLFKKLTFYFMIIYRMENRKKRNWNKFKMTK